jgi:F-type H+-transporting ATPase subunit gamma
MAGTLSIRRRIKTARNVSKTTRAMQMIAASRLKKAQEATLASRPYVERLSEVNKIVQNSLESDVLHPYMQSDNSSGKTLVIAIGPDKGLCGGLISNLIREIIAKKSDEFKFITVGKKIEFPTARLSKHVLASFPFGTVLPPFDMIYPIVDLIDKEYLSKQVDSVLILTTHFDSLFAQKPVVTKLLPISKESHTESKKEEKEENLQLFEPGASELLPPLLRHYMEMVLYQHLLESFVSEQAARMVAMQNATDNAKDIISDLTLEYNKIRQQKITNEILDITASANANYA